ncbi:MAG: uncharacterized protein KVP18_000890 [Porospora cf. gigantea A]|uniref:uncharacterized protein n=1 Tax=Porospora cf. gigantea A TaxID=2853593 RepID=UPI003559F94C|nr:MAG: hypothetical protein KVP18_000890 [Porospora cf. gigantea A]
MSDESQEGPMGSGVGSTLNESIGSIVDELRMGGLGLGGQMQNLTMNIQFEEERPQEPPQDEQPEPQETSDHPTPAAATGQSEGRARRRSRIIVRRRERRRQGERAGLSLPMLSAELHTRVQDFASSTSSTLLAAGRALVAAGISLDPAGGSVTLEEETNTSDPTEEPLPRLMQYPIPSLAEVRGLLPWRELYQLETVLEDSLGMDLAHRQPGQHHWNDFNARFLIVSTTVTLLHHRLQQWLERMENVGFIRSYVNAMTLLSAIHARLAVLSAQVFGSLSRSLPPEALEQEWTDEAPLDVGNPQEPAELELPPPLDEQTSAEKDVLEDVAPEENLQEIEHGRAVVPDATLSPVPDPRLSPLHGASSYDDAKSRDVGVQEAPPLVSRPLPVPLSDTNADEPADFDRALSTLGPGTQTLAKKWLHDPAEFSKKVMKRARCTQHSDSYLSGDWPESSSNERLASPEMLLSLNLNKALAKAGCESQAVSSAVREAYILEVLLRIAKKAVTNPDYAEMEAALPSEYAMRLYMQT